MERIEKLFWGGNVRSQLSSPRLALRFAPLIVFNIFLSACSSVETHLDTPLKVPTAVQTLAAQTEFVDLPGTDLWIMGVEVNQGFTNQVFTDLDRQPGEVGEVTGSQSASVPVIAGKPIIVRVYIGLRTQTRTPSSGMDVTGHLLAIKDSGESSFDPLDNSDCSDFLGNAGISKGQACTPVIRVYPSLGRSGFNMRSEYDLDLIDERSHWGGTLNFVIPAEFTQDLKKQLILQADVEPATRRMPTPGDNIFRVQLTNILPAKTLALRLVRVQMNPGDEPSLAEAQRALKDMTEFTPFTQVAIVSDDVFPYSGENLKLNFGLPEINKLIGTSNLNEAESLWLTLVQRYKPQSKDILLAFTPEEQEISGAEGESWYIPPNATGVSGGVAVTRQPSYAGDEDQDWERLSTIAHEIYHALFNRRHVSNSHGESSGCFFSGKLSLIIKIFSLDTLNPACFTPAPYPNGVIGAYPEIKKADNPIMGDQGGVGVRWMQEDSGWRLVLYDPCPTGGIPRDPADGNPSISPASFFAQRIPSCQISDNQLPHDFMSYGAYRWTDWDQLFDAKFTSY